MTHISFPPILGANLTKSSFGHFPQEYGARGHGRTRVWVWTNARAHVDADGIRYTIDMRAVRVGQLRARVQPAEVSPQRPERKFSGAALSFRDSSSKSNAKVKH